jgi:predicted enzyme related to lactoylglutathione lyase
MTIASPSSTGMPIKQGEEPMSDEGKFLWYELMTEDSGAARAFYGQVIGWRSEAVDKGRYWTFNTGEGGVAGLLEMPEPQRKSGVKPVWVGYVAVSDVDDYAKRFEAAGGRIHRPPEDIPGIGRFSLVADPQGAVLTLFKPQPRADGGGVPMHDGPGYPAWRELVTKDGPSAFDFYAKMFGWEKSTGHDMGPMGVYQLFAYDGADRGGVMTMPPHIPAPLWGYYFGVDSIAAATERLKAGGGTVVNGPMQVPGGSWVVQALDSQGAAFALHSANA